MRRVPILDRRRRCSPPPRRPKRAKATSSSVREPGADAREIRQDAEVKLVKTLGVDAPSSSSRATATSPQAVAELRADADVVLRRAGPRVTIDSLDAPNDPYFLSMWGLPRQRRRPRPGRTSDRRRRDRRRRRHRRPRRPSRPRRPAHGQPGRDRWRPRDQRPRRRRQRLRRRLARLGLRLRGQHAAGRQRPRHARGRHDRRPRRQRPRRGRRRAGRQGRPDPRARQRRPRLHEHDRRRVRLRGRPRPARRQRLARRRLRERHGDASIASHPNTLYVVAAGNDNADNDNPSTASYPCALPQANILCVARPRPRRPARDFSNYGATTRRPLRAGRRHRLDLAHRHERLRDHAGHVDGLAARRRRRRARARRAPAPARPSSSGRSSPPPTSTPALAGTTVTAGRLDTAAAVGAITGTLPVEPTPTATPTPTPEAPLAPPADRRSTIPTPTPPVVTPEPTAEPAQPRPRA